MISKTNCTVIFINQLREKVGIVFGNLETTTGGRAMKLVKNKIALPFKKAEFDIMFGQGISREGDLLDLATKSNIVEKSGSWYAYNGTKIDQRYKSAKNYLQANLAVCAKVEAKVRAAYGLPMDAAAPASPAPATGADKKVHKDLDIHAAMPYTDTNKTRDASS